MIIIAIDGASRGNGSVDCLSTGGAYVKINENSGYYTHTEERGSTNQRGELSALVLALATVLCYNESDAYIISDSEYLVNCINKEWYKNWPAKGWLTALGEPVKNRDMWEQVSNQMKQIEDAAIELSIYHIKGHVVSLGKVTARKLLKADATCETILAAIKAKYVTVKEEKLEEARQLFLKNHGYAIESGLLEKLVCYNTIADYVATTRADEIMEAPQ